MGEPAVEGKVNVLFGAANISGILEYSLPSEISQKHLADLQIRIIK